ncbi:MAG: hypothetical protein PHQ47_01150 [Candidatus Portnoybacteria bacterium]|nr:hypothetical protein [Candidatus Portnoybacteria bacterium]
MILFPHILTGAAIGSRIKNPQGLFFLAILALSSHYLLDFIPHFDYGIAGLMKGFSFDVFAAAAKIGIDFSFGFVLLFLLAGKKKNFYYLFAGGIIALIPDLVLFLSWQVDSETLKQMAFFGHQAHYKKTVAAVPIFLEISTQLAVSFLAILVILRKKVFTKK